MFSYGRSKAGGTRLGRNTGIVQVFDFAGDKVSVTSAAVAVSAAGTDWDAVSLCKLEDSWVLAGPGHGSARERERNGYGSRRHPVFDCCPF